MTGLRVSEVAARAGVPASTVRFYERSGLLSPARRRANGYRLFDESAVGELTLIARAKKVGMSLGDIAGILAMWRTGPCDSLRARLRAHLTARIAQAGRQIADLAAFQRRLQSALGRMTAAGPAPDRCGDGCGCDSGLAPEPAAAPALGADTLMPGCSLGAGEFSARVAEWRALADTAVSAEREGETLRMVLDPAMVPAAARLLAAEAACCTQARFTMEVAGGRVLLTAEIPGVREPA